MGNSFELIAREHINSLKDLQNIVDLKKTQCYNFSLANIPPKINNKNNNPTIFKIMNMDSLDAANYIINNHTFSQNLKPFVHNFSSNRHCGGVWCQRKGSQEETIFRRTSLPLSLFPHRAIDDNRLQDITWFSNERNEPQLPLNNVGIFYSPNVYVTRDVNNKLLKKGYNISIGSIAAQDLRYYTPGSTKFNPELCKQKLRAVLYVAHMHNHDALVLGAFGCGAYNNDPEFISSILYELLTTEFCNIFKIIVISIIKSTNNLNIFYNKFLPLLTHRKSLLQTKIVNSIDNLIQWEYLNDNNKWLPFNDNIQEQIEYAYKFYNNTITYDTAGIINKQTVKLNLNTGIQTNIKTNKQRKVRRVIYQKI